MNVPPSQLEDILTDKDIEYYYAVWTIYGFPHERILMQNAYVVNYYTTPPKGKKRKVDKYDVFGIKDKDKIMKHLYSDHDKGIHLNNIKKIKNINKILNEKQTDKIIKDIKNGLKASHIMQKHRIPISAIEKFKKEIKEGAR